METKQFKLNDKRLTQFKPCKFQVSQLYQAPHLQYQCEDCPARWLRKRRRLLRTSQTKIQVFVNKCIHCITQILINACQACLKDSQSVDITFWDFYRGKKPLKLNRSFGLSSLPLNNPQHLPRARINKRRAAVNRRGG